IIEGMAVGLPAIGIQSPGVADIVEDGVNGMLCRNDLADFTARPVRLLLGDALRARLAAGAAESAGKYDIRHTAAQLLQQYQKLRNDKARATIAVRPER
ncbi:MAG TPA: glycosyltransferase, partial [Anaerolineales bacterium]|nr:glycosyltransferase [Anaerolineales bacterium]